MYRIQLDIMATTTLEDLIDILDECEQSIDDHPIKFKLVDKSGPGGGNPVIEFYSRDEWNLKRVAEKILGHKISLTEFSDFLNELFLSIKSVVYAVFSFCVFTNGFY